MNDETITDWPQMHKDAYYGLAGEIIRTIDPHTEADPVAILVQLLVALGNMFGRKVHFKAEQDVHAPNLFVAVVASSAKGRKGTSWGIVRSLLKDVDPTWRGVDPVKGLTSGEGLVAAVNNNDVELAPRQKKMTQPEIEATSESEKDKRVLVLETEFASVLSAMKRDHNTLSQFLRIGWDSGNLQVANRRDPLRVDNAHISIVTHITKEELLRFMGSVETFNGFANRFLWICARRSKLLPHGGRIPEAALTHMRAQLRKVFEFSATVEELRRDDAANELWVSEYIRLSEEIGGVVDAITARAEPQIMRLACVYAVLDCSPIIRKEHLKAALAVWQYCVDSVTYVFGTSLGDHLANDILRKLRLRSPQGMTQTELTRAFGNNRQAREMKSALEMLSTAKLAYSESGAFSGRGRNTTTWFAAPDAVDVDQTSNEKEIQKSETSSKFVSFVDESTEWTEGVVEEHDLFNPPFWPRDSEGGFR